MNKTKLKSLLAPICTLIAVKMLFDNAPVDALLMLVLGLAFTIMHRMDRLEELIKNDKCEIRDNYSSVKELFEEE